MPGNKGWTAWIVVTIAFVFAAAAWPAWADSQARFAGAVASTTWLHIDPAIGSPDNSCAASTGGVANQFIDLTSYGFTINPAATITGIMVGPRSEDEGTLTAQLLKGGTPVGTAKSSTPTTSPDGSCSDATVIPLGGTSDLWGTTWTPADLNSSSFGVRITNPFGSGDGQLDSVEITVFFTVPQHTLTILGQGAGSGTVTASGVLNCTIVAGDTTTTPGNECSVQLDAGTPVALMAHEASDPASAFDGWIGCDSISSFFCHVTLDSDKTVTASFSIVDDFVFSDTAGNSLVVQQIETGEFIFTPAVGESCSGTGARLRGTRLSFSAVCQEDPSLKIRVTEQKSGTASVLFYERGSKKPVQSFVLQPEN